MFDVEFLVWFGLSDVCYVCNCSFSVFLCIDIIDVVIDLLG